MAAFVVLRHPVTILVTVKKGNNRQEISTRLEFRLQDHRLAGRPKNLKADYTTKHNTHQVRITKKYDQGGLGGKAEYTPRTNVHKGLTYTKAE